MYKEFFSASAIALTFMAFIPYIRSIRQGTTKPHVFSWIIWGSTTFVVFLAQLADQAGSGAWPIGVSGMITMYIAALAYQQKADVAISRLDWWFFITALTALPTWYFTADPLWAVIILTIVDVLGFGPTFSKAYAQPHGEQLKFYIIVVIRNLLAIMALQHYSITTVLFPAALAMACVVFILMVMYRRKASIAARQAAAKPVSTGSG